jgi:hypothetical protein
MDIIKCILEETRIPEENLQSLPPPPPNYLQLNCSCEKLKFGWTEKWGWCNVWNNDKKVFLWYDVSSKLASECEKYCSRDLRFLFGHALDPHRNLAHWHSVFPRVPPKSTLLLRPATATDEHGLAV